MRYFIFGTTDLAEIMFYFLKEDGIPIEGFVVDRKYLTDESKEGVPIFAFEELEEHYKKEEIAIYLCLGYTKMNRLRREKFMEIKKRGYRIESYIHKTACVETDRMGEGNFILEQAYVGMYTELGDGNIVYPKVLLGHHSKIGNFNFFAGSSTLGGEVTTADENFIGINAAVKDKTSIGSGNLIGVNAYVQHDLSDENVIAPERSVILKNKKPIDFM